MDLKSLLMEKVAKKLKKEVFMGKENRGVRDGSGPYKGSYQNQKSPGVGRRQQAGQKCPVKRNTTQK